MRKNLGFLSLLGGLALFAGCAFLPATGTVSPLAVTPVSVTPTAAAVQAQSQVNAPAIPATASPTQLPTVTPMPTATINPNLCFALTVITTPGGAGAVSASPGPDCPTDLTTYRAGTAVTLSAFPVSGASLTGWSGDASGTGLSITVTMLSGKTVTASFTSPYTGPCFTLTASLTPAGGGAVQASPAPDCPTDPTKYRPGVVVTLTEVPGAGWMFTGWGGDATGMSPSVAVTMNGNKVVAATFGAVYTGPCYALSTAVLPAGGGAVRAAPAPDCPGDVAKYKAGTVVTLSAFPASGWTFQGWGGDTSGAGAFTTVTVDGNKSVTAAFLAPPSAIPTQKP